MKKLEENIVNLYAEKGKQWLNNLPLLVTNLEKTHGLSKLKIFENLSYNYVLSGFQGLQPIVLKLGLDKNALKREAQALKAFSGFGAVNVLVEKEGILLLERAISGLSLKFYFPEKDDEAIQITSDCLKNLHQASITSDGFPHIQDWLRVLDSDFDIPADYLHKARKLRDELLTSTKKSVLLHGDLHHDNILQNGNSWMVIDPKGVIGDPAYDIATFIRNPIPQLLEDPNATSMIDNRIKQFAQTLKISRQRILNWCYVQAVLAWIWAIEDNCDQTYFKKLTELFHRA